MELIDRDEELKELKRLYGLPGAKMVLVYGRRRVGKTTLIRHFVEGKQHLYYTADTRTEHDQVEEFTRHLEELLGESAALIRFAGWPEGLKYMFERLRSEKKKTVVVFDEFSEITRQNREVPSVLRSIWDGVQRDSNVMLILSGSLVGEMEKLMQGREPLYGRFRGRMKLRPLRFRDASLFFPDRTFASKVESYAVLGGMPAYLSIGADSTGIIKTIEEDILNPRSILFEEIPFMLGQELREPARYLSVLQAIARGMTRPAQIGGATGMNASTLHLYLSRLEAMDIVDRQVPVTEKSPEKSRKGTYWIKDNFVRFWMKYVLANKYLVESNQTASVIKTIKDGLTTFTGPVFEDVVREAVIAENSRGGLPIPLARVGRFWDRNSEIDICALGMDENAYLWGECRWRKEKMGVEVLEALKQKIQDSGFGSAHNHLILCSKSGFKQSLIDKAKREPVILWDLEAVEKALS